MNEKRDDGVDLEHGREEQRRATIEELSAERTHAERGTERGAPMAPHQDRSPAEEHRGGPLPNMKK